MISFYTVEVNHGGRLSAMAISPHAPDPKAGEDLAADAPCFLPVKIVDRPLKDDTSSMLGVLEPDIAICVLMTLTERRQPTSMVTSFERTWSEPSADSIRFRLTWWSSCWADIAPALIQKKSKKA